MSRKLLDAVNDFIDEIAYEDAMGMNGGDTSTKNFELDVRDEISSYTIIDGENDDEYELTYRGTPILTVKSDGKVYDDMGDEYGDVFGY